tara:strand:+ start:396 stop:1712 length:1317 start_codon:yes stop_codon:yes gene_type:complete
MSERSKTVWNLIVGIALFSIVAASFKLLPMNKKYSKINNRSKNIKFGTDEELENVIGFLENRLEGRNLYRFMIDKEPMMLTNVLSLADGTGRRARRNRSAIRVALIYQRDNNFQAQIDYRGRVFGVTAGEVVENVGEILLIDQSRVVIKNEDRIISYPAPGQSESGPKELNNFSFTRTKNKKINSSGGGYIQNEEKKSNRISARNIEEKSFNPLKNKKIIKINPPNEQTSNMKVEEIENIEGIAEKIDAIQPQSLVEDMFNDAVDEKNKQSPNQNNPVNAYFDKDMATAKVKKFKKPAAVYGILPPDQKSKLADEDIDNPKPKKNRINKQDEAIKIVAGLEAETITQDNKKNPEGIYYPSLKHEIQSLLGFPKPAVNGNPGLMTFNELKVLLQSNTEIDKGIFEKTFKEVGHKNFQQYLDQNSSHIISILRNKADRSL